MKNKIRKIKPSDLKDFLSLLCQLSPPRPEKRDLLLRSLNGKEKTEKRRLLEMLKKIIKDENYYISVYEKNGKKIVGTATLLKQLNLSHNSRPYCHIENVVVDKNFQGHGIGTALIKDLLKKARKENCYKAILNCKQRNTPFYEKCGLKTTGEIEMRKDF